MNKPLVNALAMALAMEGLVPLQEAVEFAGRFVEENEDLLGVPQSAPLQVAQTAPLAKAERVAPVPEENLERAVVHRVPVVGPDGLTDVQRAAVGNVGLCPNCQQPNNAHLPGCARASGEDKRAVTKTPLPPVQ